MNKNIRQSAFSLMEIMLAVAVLAMGLAFIAAMFPLGIANTHRVTRNTVIGLTRSSADTLLTFQFESIRKMPGNGIGRNEMIDDPANPDGIIKVDNLVGRNAHPFYLFQPNIYADNPTAPFPLDTFPPVIYDDPTNLYFPTYPAADIIYPYQISNTPWTGKLVPDYYPQISSPGQLAPEAIGQIVYPPVDASDPEVIRLFTEYEDRFGVGNYNLTNVIYEVALTRKYSTASFYMTMDNDNLYTTRIYIFTFEHLKDNPRYAVQNGANYPWQISTLYPTQCSYNPTPRPRNEDRRFPIPWLLQIDGSAIGFDYFTVTGALEPLLRKGSYIIDADAGLDTTTDGRRGFLYKISDIEPEYNTGEFIVTLETPMIGTMKYFWVFPPAINRESGEFEEKQPVIDVVLRMKRI